ncbi:PREDICTED: protein RER1-like [Lipotes vexillifer]|uniref:Protein RER1 n=1 Tax=Lipotes vexillifer TaxID=118797 RepID=A0A340Y6T7_LIPVE|nr:PREDICTED: protein RER1-like [Lipotes vexillifer]
MVLDYRFDDLNITSRLARAVLQQREQIAHDISPLMSKLQNRRFKFDLGLKEKELCPPMPASTLFFVREEEDNIWESNMAYHMLMGTRKTGLPGARLPLPGLSEAPTWPPPASSFPRPSGDRAWWQWTASSSEGDNMGDSVHGKPSVVYRFFTSLGQVYRAWLDKSTPYTVARWVVTLGLSFIYMIRVYLLPGWYIVTYALGIHHLNLLIAFISPKVDPSLMEDSEDGPSLPTKQNEEFQSSIRRLPEFKSWHTVTKGILVAMVCTFFEAFNVPVFWPILVMYFVMLFCITMKRQIEHMIEYRYILFTHGKKTYKGKEDTGKTFAS